jgi:hypothetical protein
MTKREYRRTRIGVLIGLAWVALCVAGLGWVGSAEAKPLTLPKTVVYQKKTLTAKAKMQTFVTTDKGSYVAVHVYLDGIPIEQHYVDGCRASYPDRARGLFVWVRVKGCRNGHVGPGLVPYVVRYLSTAGPQRFTIRLTNSPED